MRALLFFGLVLILFGLIMKALKRFQHPPADARRAESDRTEEAETDTLVRCVECGVHIPRKHAIETKKGPACPHH